MNSDLYKILEIRLSEYKSQLEKYKELKNYSKSLEISDKIAELLDIQLIILKLDK